MTPSGSYMTFVGLWGVPYLVHGYGLSVVEATQHRFRPGVPRLPDRAVTVFAGIALAGALFIPRTRCRNIWPEVRSRRAA